MVVTKTRNINQINYLHVTTGHFNNNKISVVRETTAATAEIVINNLSQYTNTPINQPILEPIPVQPIQNNINNNQQVINTIIPNFNNNIENDVNNNINSIVTKIDAPCDLDDEDLKILLDNFISPYMDVGPYKLPVMSHITTYMNKINEKIPNCPRDQNPRIYIYKNILDLLVRGRSMYFYDLELEATNTNLRNKISELQNLVYQYSSELALCNGEQDGFVLGGSMGIKLVKPKNLIYAQALLNINLAWYIYLYNTKKIEYEKYEGVVQYIQEKGKQQAYDELIVLLDEKFRDIEEEISNENNEVINTTGPAVNIDGQAVVPNNNKDDCECPDPEQVIENYFNPDNYLHNENLGRALLLQGSLSISITEKFELMRQALNAQTNNSFENDCH